MPFDGAPANAERVRPSQAVLGACARAIFAADPAVVADAVKHRENLRIAYLSLVRLMPRGDRGDLHVPDQGEMFFEAPDQIAAHDLRMKKIELNAHVWPLHLGNNIGSVFHAGTKVVRPIARVDRLDQQSDLIHKRYVGRACKIADEGELRRRALFGRYPPGKTVNLGAADCFHIGERLRKEAREFRLAAGHRGNTEFAASRSPRRRVDTQHGEPMALELDFDLRRRMIIWNLQSDSAKARRGSGGKALQERPLGEEIG